MWSPADTDTVAAVSSPFGEGAVALLRVTGPEALAVAANVCRLRAAGREFGKLAPRVAHRAHFVDPVAGRTLDDGLVTVYRAPASYTGEDLVELSCHGGLLVTRRVLDALLAAGARPAEPGEFTRRAFLQGKLDLTQAEAVMDVIRAGTDLSLRAAEEQLAGRLGERIEALRRDLLGLVAHVEAFIDFPEEGIDPDTGAALLGRCDDILAGLDALLATADQGRILREGVRTVIYGEPNVGKSSLLNALVGHERAIVSEVPGTTRDTVEEFLNVRGLPLRLVDTAGLRESVADAVEREGIARTRATLARADLALRVVDASRDAGCGLRAAGLPEAAATEILVLNKADLGLHPSWQAVLTSEANPSPVTRHPPPIPISCRTGAGLDALADAIFQRVTGGAVAWNDAAPAVNARHANCLRRAREALTAGRALLAAGESPEFAALDLREALAAVGEVVGGADTESILGEIFATFCIGK